MSQAKHDDEYTPEETQRRMENAIRRALNTPPKPHKEMVGKTKRAKARRRSRLKKSGRAKRG